MQWLKTPIESVQFKTYSIHIKRDDLIHSQFSGNKARKFHYFLDHSFPEVNKIIGYGSPQANSLYSLAALAKMNNWQLDFYVDHIPSFLLQNPFGNYAAAIQLGASIVPIGDQRKGNKARPNMSMEDYISEQILPHEKQALWIPEGGRCEYAEYGIKQLADEILDWVKQQHLTPPFIFLPSGTGTTALFLQKHLPFPIYTCACVGDEAYLQQQFSQLSNNTSHYPTILPRKKKYHFGKLYPEFYHIWQELKRQTGITFELLYDPPGWLSLLDYLQSHFPTGKPYPPILYIHQGGLMGNESMLPRYERKFPTSQKI